MDLNQMMRQVQTMQQDMVKAQEELQQEVFTASSVNAFVTIEATGDKRIRDIKIKPEVMDADDPDMLEDLVMTTFNTLMDRIDQATQDKMGRFTQGLPF